MSIFLFFRQRTPQEGNTLALFLRSLLPNFNPNVSTGMTIEITTIFCNSSIHKAIHVLNNIQILMILPIYFYFAHFELKFVLYDRFL